jgi:hypothetical protein
MTANIGLTEEQKQQSSQILHRIPLMNLYYIPTHNYYLNVEGGNFVEMQF